MATRSRPFLVVGGDGFIGRALCRWLSAEGYEVVATTRRNVSLQAPGVSTIHLDLREPIDRRVHVASFEAAFLCAGVTSIEQCEVDPAGTEVVNVTRTVELAQALSAFGVRVLFLSSNAVFDGKAPFPDENVPYSGGVEYGRQKMRTEISLLDSCAGLAVVRLSKVVSREAGIGAEIFARLSRGTEIEVFSDLNLCPISAQYVVNGLMAISRSGEQGVFHLSGSQEMSYEALARQVIRRLRPGEERLVRAVRIADSGKRVVFAPRHPGLGMRRTSADVEVEPQSTDDFLSDYLGAAA